MQAHPQPKDPLQSIEVPVVMQQFEIPFDARSCNDDVDGLVNGHAFGAQGAIVPRSLNTDLVAT